MILVNFIIIFILLTLIDIPMITIINNKMYQDAFYKINNKNISTGNIGIITGIICYLLLTFGIYYFIVSPEINNNTRYDKVFIKGLLLGLVVYGIYNTTNKATINNYSTLVTIVDTMWGTLLMGIISILSFYIIKKIK
jgi:uncharacterized membrane protein